MKSIRINAKHYLKTAKRNYHCLTFKERGLVDKVKDYGPSDFKSMQKDDLHTLREIDIRCRQLENQEYKERIYRKLFV